MGGMLKHGKLNSCLSRGRVQIRAPAQRVGDFLAAPPMRRPRRVKPTYRPAFAWFDLRRSPSAAHYRYLAASAATAWI
jgi:hypothetical protein